MARRKSETARAPETAPFSSPSEPPVTEPEAQEPSTITISVSARWGMERALKFREAVEHFQATAPETEHVCGFSVTLD